jgi:hypothetical protein
MIIREFKATIMEMASSEIMSHIPASVYEAIKAKDPHPEFRAYVVGHEGISEGKVVGAGDIVKRWFASAVEKIAEKLQYGTKIFHKHGKTNEHDGRSVIGHIVGKAKQVIKDSMSAIAIAYIKPEYRDLKLDVASIEADVILSEDQNSGIYDANVEDITGIALGDSSFERPGFSGATLLSQIQAFAQSHQYNKGGEVRDFIRKENLKPSDFFGLGELTKDPMVVEHIEASEKKALTGEYEGRKRDEKGFEKAKEDLKKEHDDATAKLNDQIAKLQGENIQTKTATWLEAQKAKRELNDEQVKFITRDLPKFKPKDMEKAEDEFNKFLDDEIDDLSGIKKDVFGQEDDGDKNKAPGGETKNKKSGSDTMDDMSLTD